jgi:hypothetical protein
MTNPGQIRPTPVAEFSKIRDPGTRSRAILADIAAQRAAKQQQAQSQTPEHDPEVVRLANEQIQTAQAAGNHLLAIALKRQLANYMQNPYPTYLKGQGQ